MNSMGISTDPAMLDVELPRTLLESASVSTFLPEEEASVCPLLSTGNGSIPSPLTFSHPLTPGNDTNSGGSMENVCQNGTQMETRSLSGSSSGIGMDVPDSTSSPLFNNKHAYHHLQLNNDNHMMADTNGHVPTACGMTSQDTPSFVSWNWPLIRKSSFVVFMSILMSLCVLVVALIVTLPKTCNPKTAWYRGSVFYEIFPASFQDSNNDGVGDIRGIANRVEYFATLNVRAIRLNSIFPSPHYPDDYENVTTLTEIAKELGSKQDVAMLAQVLHSHNISLVLDLPLKGIVHELGKVSGWRLENATSANDTAEEDDEPVASPVSVPVMTDSLISEAINSWLALGVDGFYIKGLEAFLGHLDLVENFYEWKRLLGPSRALIISESLFDQLEEGQKAQVLQHVNLVDVQLDVDQGVRFIEKRINEVLEGPLSPLKSNVWIHWSLGGVHNARITDHSSSPNITLASTVMQLMLPGTPNIFYGDEIALAKADDVHRDHENTKHMHHLAIMQWPNRTAFTNHGTLAWLPQSPAASLDNIVKIAKLIALRDQSPSLYNNAICKVDSRLANTEIRTSLDDILIVERVYPRRNTYVSITNYSPKFIRLDMTALYYSGIIMTSSIPDEKMYFKDFQIGPHETLVVKLDK